VGSDTKNWTPELVRGEVVNVKEYPHGAVADNSTDDAAAINSAASEVRGTDKVLLIPNGTYRVDSQLDFRRVRRLVCYGKIASTYTAGPAALIGTEQNANNDLENGNVGTQGYPLDIRKRDFTVTAGTVGIRCFGFANAILSARCSFYETGLEIVPDDDVGTAQYFANNKVYFSNFADAAGTTALKCAGVNGGFINENLFLKLQSGKARTGVKMDGGECENNRFLASNLEQSTYPIDVDRGSYNLWMRPRLENTTSVRWGRNAHMNVVLSASNGTDGLAPSVEWKSAFPNFVLPATGLQWRTIYRLTRGDWQQHDPSAASDDAWVNSRDVLSQNTGLEFVNATMTANEFQIAGGDRGDYIVPVQTGDVFEITAESSSTDPFTFTVVALDGSKSNLGALTSGDLPYIGSSRFDISAGTSGTGATFDVNKYLKRIVSVNRDEVKFLNFKLRGNDPFSAVEIRMHTMERGRRDVPVTGDQIRQPRFVQSDPSSLTPEYVFETVIRNDTSPKEVWKAVDPSTFVQIG